MAIVLKLDQMPKSIGPVLTNLFCELTCVYRILNISTKSLQDSILLELRESKKQFKAFLPCLKPFNMAADYSLTHAILRISLLKTGIFKKN